MMIKFSSGINNTCFGYSKNDVLEVNKINGFRTSFQKGFCYTLDLKDLSR